MKILIIGNSHVGSLKRAWDYLIDQYQNISLYFIASRGSGLSNLKIDNYKIYSDDSELSKSMIYTYGSPEVDIIDLKPAAILFYGMGLTFPVNFINQVINKNFSKNFTEKVFEDFFNKWECPMCPSLSCKA